MFPAANCTVEILIVVVFDPNQETFDHLSMRFFAGLLHMGPRGLNDFFEHLQSCSVRNNTFRHCCWR